MKCYVIQVWTIMKPIIMMFTNNLNTIGYVIPFLTENDKILYVI